MKTLKKGTVLEFDLYADSIATFKTVIPEQDEIGDFVYYEVLFKIKDPELDFFHQHETIDDLIDRFEVIQVNRL